MARPKTKSALVEGISELVTSLRNIESKISKIFVGRNGMMTSGPKSVGRPPGSGKKSKRGRPAGSGRGPGRPPGSPNKARRGRPATGKAKPGRPSSSTKRRGRGRPKGSKNN